MDNIFHGPRLKVERAKKHIDDFNQEIIEFTGRDPYGIIEDRDSQPGKLVIRYVVRAPPPHTWPLLVGDAIHNLRSALDLLACDIMQMHG
jgi:hypothetical protein